jgi:cortexillin 1/2
LPIDQRLEKAFEIAEKTINIPKLLDVNEVMKGTTDERALILYTSLFFHAFSAQAQARAAAGKHDSLLQGKEELMKKVSELEKAKYATSIFLYILLVTNFSIALR